MRLVFVLVMFAVLAGLPTLAQEACDPYSSGHTNPPILGKKGNSVCWFWCDPDTTQWTRLEGAYNVFVDGECDESNTFLDDDFFGTAVDKNKPATLKDLDEVWHPTIGGDEYKLEIDFRRKKPTKYKLCKIGGPCCKLKADSDRHGTIPYEFEQLSEDKITYGSIFTHKGKEPLEFATCKHAGCAHVDTDDEQTAK